MNINELKKLESEDITTISSRERRTFIKAGLGITGLFMGGTILSLSSSTETTAAVTEKRAVGKFPYSPHYTMVMVQNHCINCELCMDACVKTNNVPEYGWRTTILSRNRLIGPGKTQMIFMSILCNQCNRPPCVRVCPTTSTYKDEKTGIVMMVDKKCIGCKTCMVACPYNARYFNKEKKAVDKCDFCVDTKLKESGGKTTACVEACPAHSRRFGDLNDPESEVYQLIHKPDNVVWVLRPETGALPNVFYMNLDLQEFITVGETGNEQKNNKK